jgi:hypothetical protein
MFINMFLVFSQLVASALRTHDLQDDTEPHSSFVAALYIRPPLGRTLCGGRSST